MVQPLNFNILSSERANSSAPAAPVNSTPDQTVGLGHDFASLAILVDPIGIHMPSEVRLGPPGAYTLVSNHLRRYSTWIREK